MKPAQTGDNVMKLSSIGAATAACCWLLSGILPAQAGYWNYGCKGNLGDKASGNLGDSVVAFDRNALLVLPADFAKGDIAGLGKGRIYAFEADADPMDFNAPSFKPTMSFTRTAYPDQKIVLTEKSRKTISQRQGTYRHPRDLHRPLQDHLPLQAGRLAVRTARGRHRDGLF